ncbi:hypothetical protein K438DRAFT_226474 [Mycena galopus ATCC 62051]|nr:hypothetical protein K438DRAFT_226474 [Mycena galopus ATCC 62051]
MRYDDPANTVVLAVIHAGRAPPSILNVRQGQYVDVQVTHTQATTTSRPRPSPSRGQEIAWARRCLLPLPRHLVPQRHPACGSDGKWPRRLRGGPDAADDERADPAGGWDAHRVPHESDAHGARSEQLYLLTGWRPPREPHAPLHHRHHVPEPHARRKPHDDQGGGAGE